MLNLLGKFFTVKSDHHKKKELRNQFKEYFLSQPEHAWITVDSQVQFHFEMMLKRLPIGLIEKLFFQHALVFVPSSEFKNKELKNYSLKNTVVVFPQFEKLLRTNKNYAEAYLAHEVAFLVYELEEPAVDPMMAEVEADKFVCDLGLADELEQLLLAMDESPEKRLRLTYLTLKAFGLN
ncbi:MAG: hypothetical protein ACOVP4_14850 [Bacteriovoracaceae bacterium]|jgi:hypothetical protein